MEPSVSVQFSPRICHFVFASDRNGICLDGLNHIQFGYQFRHANVFRLIPIKLERGKTSGIKIMELLSDLYCGKKISFNIFVFSFDKSVE